MSDFKKSVKAGPKRKRTASSPRMSFDSKAVKEFIHEILRRSLSSNHAVLVESSEILQPIERIKRFSVSYFKVEILSQQYRTLLRTTMQATNTMETTAKKDLDGLLKVFQFILLDFVQKGYFRPTQILPALTLMVFCRIAQKEPQSALGQQTALEVFKLLATLPQARRDFLIDYMNPLDA